MSYYGYQSPPYGQPPQQQYGQQPYQHNQQQYQQPPGQYQQQPPPGQYQQQPHPGQYQQQYQQQPPLGQHQQPPPGPPYGAPSPQGQYQQSPQNSYYQQPPQPSPGGYYQQPPQQPYGAPPPQQQQQQWGPPPPAPYGQPQPGYGQQPPQQPFPGAYPPTPPTLGYGPPQAIAWDGKDDATALRKAMKGFGTDEKTLIRILANLDPLQAVAVRDTFQRLFGRNLINDIKSETSGWFEVGLVALARGPLMHDVYLLHDALDGPGTKENVLNDVLLGRSNADIAAIKSAYAQVHRGHTLEAKVRGDLSMKTERHFMMVLAGNRNEDSQPVIQSEVDKDVMELYKATEGKIGTDELLVCDIFTHRNDAQLRAIAHAYQQKFRVKLEDVVKREFSGHMKDALLFQLRHACDKYMHCAMLLEDAMAGMGTKDHLLVSRVVRFHWNKLDMANIRGAYQKLRGTPLPKRIRGETSGDYERLMLACIGES